MKKKISLKKAIIIPISILIIFILIIFIFLWKKDYHELSKYQSEKMIKNVMNHTKKNLNSFLNIPTQLIQVSKESIKYNEYYNNRDLLKIENYLRNIYKTTSNIDHISVLGYADERENFIGIRNNYNSTYSLMLQDYRTNYNLNIYKGETLKSDLIASYENYNPKKRPFYKPLRKKMKRIWTKIYINNDEKKEATITVIDPVIENEMLIGGVLADVKLNKINDFLQQEKITKNSIIYLLDEDHKIIAHSEGKLKLLKDIDKDEDLKYQLPNPIMIDDKIINKSYKHLLNEGVYDDIITYKIDNDIFYLSQKHWNEIDGLDWTIVTVIPENDLIGKIKVRHNKFIIFVTILIIIMGICIFYFLNKINKKISQNIILAEHISSGEFNYQIKNSNFFIKELSNLESVLLEMAFKLKTSFIKLKRNEEKYKLLVENIDHIIYSLSSNGKIITVNQRFLEEYSVSEKDIFGKRLDKIFNKEENKEFWKDLIDEIKNKKNIVSSIFNYNDNKIFKVQLIPLLNSDLELMMILGTNIDITELVKANKKINELARNRQIMLEKEVEKRTKKLKMATDELIEREKLASLGSLVSGVAHEINTPLGIAVTSSSYIKKINNNLMKKIDSNDLSKEEFLDNINSINQSIETLDFNLERASDLIKNFKKISVKQSSEEKIKFNISEYINAVLSSLKYEFKNTNYEINIICDENLEVISHPGVFSQILTNLLINSKTHGFKNLEKGEITIKFYKSENKLILHYADTGHGIPKENHDKIFEPFFTTNRKNGGSGLGLSIIYNLVTARLNGKINLESSASKGTIFTLSFNLNKKNEII